jgi:hypothetical protein
MVMTEKYRYCKKCLMREMYDQDEFFATLKSHIENIPPERKSSDELYEYRLQVCKECELLVEGMCRRCGCYVELRAASEKNYCPDKKW